MPYFSFNYPLGSTAESNDTLIAKTVVRVLDCTIERNSEDLCSLWNASHCPTDRDYCNPFFIGDKIYLQKKIAVGSTQSPTSFVYAKVIDTSTGLEVLGSENFLLTELFSDKNLGRYINLIIDSVNLPLDLDCFYVSLKAFSCDLKGDKLNSFNTCVEDLVSGGKTLKEAQEICIEDFCTPVIVYSEPYCRINNCVNTIMLEGNYPVSDCEGNYYSSFNPLEPNSFKLQIRTFGEIFKSQFDISETLLNNSRRKTKLISSYQLLTKLVPEYVAQRIALIFAAQEVFIDGEQYEKTIIVPKNTERGKMWHVAATITRSCDETDFTCQ